MATAIQLLRSKVARLRPAPGTLSEGMPMVNIAADEPGLFFSATDGSLVKIGPAFVGTMAPNNAPSGFGGNTIGEIWVDVTDANKTIFKVWDGSEWKEVSGGATNSTTPPATPDGGDIWFDPTNDELNFWDGTEWIAVITGPVGLDTEIQFNDAGEFGTDSDFTYNKTTNTLTSTNFVGSDVTIDTLTTGNIDLTVLNPLP